MTTANATRHIFAESDFHTLELFVRSDADLDDTFTATCADTGETLRVNGWLFSITDADSAEYA